MVLYRAISVHQYDDEALSEVTQCHIRRRLQIIDENHIICDFSSDDQYLEHIYLQ